MRASSLPLQQRLYPRLGQSQPSQGLAQVVSCLPERGNASGIVAGLAPAGE